MFIGCYKLRSIMVLASLIVMDQSFLPTGRKRAPLPDTEEPMIILDSITALFYEVDEQMGSIPQHPQAHLWPSEGATLRLLHARKGVGNRAFSHWSTRHDRCSSPADPSAPGSCVSARPIKTERGPFWSLRPCSASLIRTAWWWRGRVPRPLAPITLFSGSFASVKNA